MRLERKSELKKNRGQGNRGGGRSKRSRKKKKNQTEGKKRGEGDVGEKAREISSRLRVRQARKGRKLATEKQSSRNCRTREEPPPPSRRNPLLSSTNLHRERPL